ncbi:glycosyltransferase family 2 protein [Candidatus Methylospira mobilis]|uniref:Glycosyltransferase family 2 protein n=1 Tax=Candidatus Methylospira mobilis TaxID=1808979 RepID=A0A5Q0BGR0_9GAMM|nr:glycosyltransferase family 2 protein [Candidatus Methylospira mobilis]QFY41401.1 glycosyltransferase family 2 protein [Candidatus Methylospira mobilis]
MKLSVVATLYQSAPYLLAFHHRVTQSAREWAGDDYEIILVNDGSPDNSLELAVRQAGLDPHIVVVDLSRNFGHHKAMMTGLAHAQGEYVFLIDSDLEEEPEWLPVFAEYMAQCSCDVVYGVQSQRRGGWFERWSGRWFYRLVQLLTGMDLPENVITARLMRNRYVEALVRHDEREVFIAGLWYITGFDQQPYAVVKHSTSATTYSLRHKLAMLVNSVTSFSSAPLIAIFNLGLFISLCAAVYFAYLIILWQFFARPLSGWTSVMASIWLLGGLTIFFIGVIGIYLSRIYSETKRRPYTIIRKIYGQRRNG